MARCFTEGELEQIKDFFNNCEFNPQNLRNRIIFYLGILTGFRIQEICQISVEMVYDIKTREILESVKLPRRFLKGQIKSRTIHINEQLKDELNNFFKNYSFIYGKHPEKKDLIISSTTKFKGVNLIPFNPSNANRILINQIYIPACQKRGVNISTHSLRKTFAQKIYESSNHDIFAVKEMLGHANVSTTQKYLGLLNEEKKTDLVNSIKI